MGNCRAKTLALPGYFLLPGNLYKSVKVELSDPVISFRLQTGLGCPKFETRFCPVFIRHFFKSKLPSGGVFFIKINQGL